MDLTPEYLKAEEGVIIKCTNYCEKGGSPERYGTIKAFCSRYNKSGNKVLSVGSAGYEPILIGATHALDVSDVAEKLLRANGWKGIFTRGSCTDLPFKNREFDCGCCSEVVEHLPRIEDVGATLNELDRVCKAWMLSTPATPNNVKDHKRLLTREQASAYAKKYGAQVMQHARWWFLWKGIYKPIVVRPAVPRGATHG